MSVLYFLLMIIPLVFFHEWGHYIAAKRFGVKCPRFAVGVGPVVLSFNRDETEFSIRALPLGGYVQMLGMSPDDEIPEEDKGRALTDKPVWQRMIIYFAGPLANFILAAPLFFLVFTAVAERPDATVGTVFDGSAAHEAGLLAGDRVLSIDGSQIQYFDQISDACSSSPEQPLAFVVQRGDQEVSLTLTPERVRVPEPMTRLRTIEIGQAGFTWRAYSAFVHVDAGSAAAQAGLQTFDRIVKVGDREVSSYIELAGALRDASGPQELLVRRATALDAGWMQSSVQSLATVTLPNAGDPLELGIRSAESSIFSVEPSSPAAAAGFEVGDRVTSWNDQAITATGVLLQRIEGAPEQAHVFAVDRDGETVEITLTPEVRTVVAEFQAERLETFVGFSGLRGSQIYAAGSTITVPWPSRLWFALRDAVVETIGFIGAIFMGLLFLMIGQVDSSNLGGPLMIADVANRAAQGGYLSFLQFMAKISINLGMVNLMPIPGLDGGNLALLIAEGIKREPLSYRTRQIIGYVGMVCIILLMVLVFKNDIERYWVDIADWLNS